MFTIMGRTTDGKTVVAGVFRFVETHGIPLEILLEGLDQRGHLPCWMSFVREARAAGMAHDRILNKLDPAIADVYGGSFRDTVIASLRKLIAAGSL